ncbi:MAG: flagellar biosynthetic protein FliO [Thermoguttaceae bacterium]|nr:flagellar biosynthetic protein FliO [Thermoguttaceae bacterium]
MSVILLLLLTLSCTPALAQSSIPLSPDAAAVEQNESSSERSAAARSFLPTIGAIAIVTGTLALILWLLKKSQGDVGRQIPSSIVKTLGKTRIGTTPVFLVTVGKKLVLVAASSNGLTPLTEINDPAEADAIRKALAENNGGEK